MRNPKGWEKVDGGVIWSPPSCDCGAMEGEHEHVPIEVEDL